MNFDHLDLGWGDNAAVKEIKASYYEAKRDFEGISTLGARIKETATLMKNSAAQLAASWEGDDFTAYKNSMDESADIYVNYGSFLEEFGTSINAGLAIKKEIEIENANKAHQLANSN